MNGEAMAHFLDAHNLFACNTAFQHPAIHKTTYQQKRKDNTTGLDVVIYNMIDFIICRQSQQSLLLDARSYAGTVLNSDHRLVVSRIRLSRVFGMWGRKPQNFTKPKHYSVDLLSDVNESSKYKQHLTSCMNELSDEFEAAETAQTQLKYVVKAIEEAAASSIGITPPSRSQSQTFCPEINRMSHEQKMLRLRIDNTQDAEISNALKQQRNRLQHAIRRKALENATTKLDQKIEEIERLHDGAKMFKSVRLPYRTQYRQPTIHDDQGRAIQDQETYGKHVSDFFSDQFQGDVKQGITAFTGEPRPLQYPITASEVEHAMNRLNNNRASGSDELPGELLKHGSNVIAKPIADIFNRAITDQEVLSQIGHGIIILLPKPGKPIGAMTSLRPIVLLNTLRKALSLIVLSRISDKVDEFLYPGQSGFRRGRSTADVLFGYRWLAAKTQRFQKSFRVLGIDMSRAFDTIRRDKLLTVLETLQPRLKRGMGSTFATTIGTPQGDSLSPVLFVIYLEAALRDLRHNLPQRPREDINMPHYIAYADDVDFISNSNMFLNEVQRLAPGCLLQWHLGINESKTEHTNIHRRKTRDVEQRRKTRKLGSLLG